MESKLEDGQCGFCPCRSTTDQISTLKQIFEKSWENCKNLFACFVDLEKVYDRVPRDKLWKVLQEYGVLVNCYAIFILLQTGGRPDECATIGNCKISRLLFADDLVLLSSTESGLQRALYSFADACNIDTRIGKASAVLRALHYSVVMRRELSKKAKLSIFKAIFVPILTYGHEYWVMIERMRSQMQASEMRFLRRIERVTLFNKVRSSEIRKSLNIEPLLLRIERSQLRWFSHESRMPQERLPKQALLAKANGKRTV